MTNAAYQGQGATVPERAQLEAAEQKWLAATEAFTIRLDKLGNVQGRIHGKAAASLSFGPDGLEREIWLGLLVSYEPGAGREMLDLIKQLADSHSLTIVGKSTPMKPEGWAEGRRFMVDPDDLMAWYIKHGFSKGTVNSQTYIYYPAVLPDRPVGS